MALKDAFERPLRNLRLSVTDRCNLRCQYCMPEEEYVWLPRESILTFEELSELAGIFAELGVDKVRLTGGEPLIRKGLPVLVRMLARNDRIADLALTTNGIHLAEQAMALRNAGLGRVTVSLDTLHAERFKELTRRDGHARVLEGIRAVKEAGFGGLKTDTVLVRGFNDDEISDLLEFGRGVGAEVRFIEYMDVGGATRWSMDKVFPAAEILAVLGKRYGRIERIPETGSAPADRYLLPDGTVFGIIASTTMPFCASCDRSRLTADGVWYLCLYAGHGIDLRGPLRAGATGEELKSIITSGWVARRARGAEERKQISRRTALVSVEGLSKDPHLEMHTRGG